MRGADQFDVDARGRFRRRRGAVIAAAVTGPEAQGKGECKDESARNVGRAVATLHMDAFCGRSRVTGWVGK